MKAITTKYLGATATKGARIAAFDMDGNRIVIPWPATASGIDSSDVLAYRTAAIALCKRLGWPRNLTGGAVKDGYVFVFKEVQR